MTNNALQNYFAEGALRTAHMMEIHGDILRMVFFFLFWFILLFCFYFFISFLVFFFDYFQIYSVLRATALIKPLLVERNLKYGYLLDLSAYSFVFIYFFLSHSCSILVLFLF